MSCLRISRICVVCLLIGFISSVAQAASSFSFGSSSNKKDSSGKFPRTTTNRPWGNIGSFKPGINIERHFSNNGNGFSFSYNFSSRNPGNSLNPGNTAGLGYFPNGAPGTGWPSANQATLLHSAPPFTAQMPQATTSGQPRIEIEVSETFPYEQQNILYTAKVVSSNNLKTLDPLLPRIEGAVLEKVDGPIVSVRTNRHSRAREIVNEYRFKLTPLRPGEIVIPAIRFKGTHAASNRQWGRSSSTGGEAFTITSDNPVSLEVQSADPAVDPWLPLHDLKLQPKIMQDHPSKEGIPVTVVLELSAKGALGDQLPSLEKQLVSNKFRAYRESTTIKNGISKDGKYLIGSRRETYTLIPLQDGWIHLPDLSVVWWDVDTDKARYAGLPGKGSGVIANGSGAASSNTGNFGAQPGYFWFPLLIALGLIVGYWLGAWARSHPVFKNAKAGIAQALRPVKDQTARATHFVIRSLTLTRYLNKLRMGVASMMPMQVKLWMCSRCVERENNPREWCHAFKQRICQHLKISSHTPLPDIAERIIAVDPQVDPDRIRALIQSLDGAIYGGQSLDFAVWKRDLDNQLRPRARRRARRSQRSRSVLPGLNPHSA